MSPEGAILPYDLMLIGGSCMWPVIWVFGFLWDLLFLQPASARVFCVCLSLDCAQWLKLLCGVWLGRIQLQMALPGESRRGQWH